MLEPKRIVGKNKSGENVWSCLCSCGLGCLVAESRLEALRDRGCAENKGDNQFYNPENEVPRVDLSQRPEFAPLVGAAQELLSQLRAQNRALSGDGFGYVGDLKSAYKRAVKQVEAVLHVLENAPADVDLFTEQ